ncbi:MAG: hypothetical protein FWH03_02555 [Firmicutes bacterium]|nr:hypothetical protein [Bacillota bacterium]
MQEAPLKTVEERLMKIETHCHTLGVSFCSQVAPEHLGYIYKRHGFRMVVLTNHLSRQALSKCAFTYADQLKMFINEFNIAKTAAQNYGVKVLLGAEVAISSPLSPYTEFMLFGLTPEFLHNMPPLFDLRQRTLFKLCSDNGILMYQAHPLRFEHGHSPQDPEFMHGVEINCHPAFQTYFEQIVDFANRYNLGISCGSDMHHKSQAGHGGMFVDKSVKTEQDLAAYMRAHPRPKILLDPKVRVTL